MLLDASWEGFDMDATANADLGRTRRIWDWLLSVPAQSQRRRAPVLCSAGTCHLVRRRCLGGSSGELGRWSVMSGRIIPTSWGAGRQS
jgi:hypothetical protein